MYNIQQSISILIDAIKKLILNADLKKKSINFFLILKYNYGLTMITWILICITKFRLTGKNILSLKYFHKLYITLIQLKLCNSR